MPRVLQMETFPQRKKQVQLALGGRGEMNDGSPQGDFNQWAREYPGIELAHVDICRLPKSNVITELTVFYYTNVEDLS